VRQFHKGRLLETPQSQIWRKPEKGRRRIVHEVCAHLLASVGKPRLGNPRNPVDDLVFLMLSNRTQFDTAKRVFQSLKTTGSWDAVSRLPVRTLERRIQIAGLAKKRSQQMKQALVQIRGDFGRCTLDQLRTWDESSAHDYLVELPGVSDKVAKCVMMYTLGFKVLPVDIHVFRVASRLGWTSRCRADQCHDDLESLVPPSSRYAFHVDCIVLGRTICTPRAPNCHACPIRKFCFYYQQRNEPTREA
jgi:endonuclease III